MKRLLILITLILTAIPAHAARQFDFLLSQVRSGSTSLANGKVYFYAAGTTIAKNVWLNPTGTTAAANPYTLDANGTAQVYGVGLYHVVIKDSNGVTRFDRDNIAVEQGGDPLFFTGGTVNLPLAGEVFYGKSDSSATPVTLVPAPGTTVDGMPSYELYLQGETVHLKLVGSNWYKL